MVSIDEMNSTSPKKVTGRRLNYDQMRSPNQYATGILTSRAFENNLPENGVGEARTIKNEDHPTGISEGVENQQPTLRHRNNRTNN